MPELRGGTYRRPIIWAIRVILDEGENDPPPIAAVWRPSVFLVPRPLFHLRACCTCVFRQWRIISLSYYEILTAALAKMGVNRTVSILGILPTRRGVGRRTSADMGGSLVEFWASLSLSALEVFQVGHWHALQSPGRSRGGCSEGKGVKTSTSMIALAVCIERPTGMTALSSTFPFRNCAVDDAKSHMSGVVAWRLSIVRSKS